MNDLSRLAAKYFKLELPCTEVDLKKAFKKAAKDCHPDLHPGDNAAKEQFQRLNEAYQVLCDKPEIFVSSEALPSTVDGILLSTLGLGLEGAAGTPCTSCETKGYTTVQGDPFINCSMCRGTGAIVTCPSCRGKGKQLRPLGGRCGKCEGKGVLGVSLLRGLFTGHNYSLCTSCHGAGGFKSSKPVFKHYKCGDCEGKGQRPMFNPLWPKMRVGR